LRGVYLENAFLRDIHLNYLTKFDSTLRIKWSKRTLPAEQKPEILRNIIPNLIKKEPRKQKNNII